MRLWNELPLDIRNSTSLSIFKSKLHNHGYYSNICPEWYSSGDRYASILHTRLRLGSSQLNSHLFKIGVKSNSSCACGAKNEDAWHFFFQCPFYTVLRSNLHTIVSKFAPISLQTVLYGSFSCTLLENVQIFAGVQHYVMSSARISKTGIG